MTIKELRDLVDGNTILWIETAEEEYLEAGEADGLSKKYDSCTIGRMFVQHYPSIYAHGITVQICLNCPVLDCREAMEEVAAEAACS